MEQETISDVTVSSDKIYNRRAIWIGTFIGGPLAAGYMLAKNFKTIGEADRIKITWIIASLATVVIFGIAYMIPADSKFPAYILPLIYMSTASGIFMGWQQKKVDAFLTAGGQAQNWGWTLLMAVIILAITLAVLLGIAFLGQFVLMKSS